MEIAKRKKIEDDDGNDDEDDDDGERRQVPRQILNVESILIDAILIGASL